MSKQATQSDSELQSQPEQVKSVPLISTSKPDDEVLTLEKLEEYFESAKKAAENPQPHYTLLPDMAVDLYLERGIIPQFVMVSSTSIKKIRAYIKAHPEADDQGNDLQPSDSDTKIKGAKAQPSAQGKE